MKQQVTLPAGRATQTRGGGGMGEATSALACSRLRSVYVIHYKRAVECVYTGKMRILSASLSAFYRFNNLQIRMSASPHFTPGPGTETLRHRCRSVHGTGAEVSDGHFGTDAKVSWCRSVRTPSFLLFVAIIIIFNKSTIFKSSNHTLHTIPYITIRLVMCLQLNVSLALSD